jgi:hypothetical protein
VTTLSTTHGFFSTQPSLIFLAVSSVALSCVAINLVIYWLLVSILPFLVVISRA